MEVRTEYLEATLGLDKRLEISKKLICECVSVPGCCLLHASYKYVRKNTLLAAKGGCICAFAPPLPPLNPPLVINDHGIMQRLLPVTWTDTNVRPYGRTAPGLRPLLQ